MCICCLSLTRDLLIPVVRVYWIYILTNSWFKPTSLKKNRFYEWVMLSKYTCTVCTVHIQVHIREELNWLMADRLHWVKELLYFVVTMVKNIAGSQKAALCTSHPLSMCLVVVTYFLTKKLFCHKKCSVKRNVSFQKNVLTKNILS